MRGDACLSRDGKDDLKPSPAAWFAPVGDCSVMRRDNLLYDKKANTLAAGFRGRKQFKDIDTIRQTDTAIADLQPDRFRAAIKFDGQAAALWHRLDGILAEIQDHLLHFCGIQADRGQRVFAFEFDRNTGRPADKTLQGQLIFDNLRQIADLESKSL